MANGNISLNQEQTVNITISGNTLSKHKLIAYNNDVELSEYFEEALKSKWSEQDKAEVMEAPFQELKVVDGSVSFNSVDEGQQQVKTTCMGVVIGVLIGVGAVFAFNHFM
jgi:hypothetical protein